MTESTNHALTIYIVGDESDRRSIVDVVHEMNLDASEFASTDALLIASDGKPGILVCDVQPGTTGIEFQRVLSNRDIFMPCVIVTNLPETRFVVEAMKGGATSVLEKPFTAQQLRQSIEDAIADYQNGYKRHLKTMDAKSRLSSLTEQEEAVLRLVMDGALNKRIARELDVSVRTVESRRRKILDKVNVDNFVELARLVVLVELNIPPAS